MKVLIPNFLIYENIILNDLDRRILRFLQSDPAAPLSELAERCQSHRRSWAMQICAEVRQAPFGGSVPIHVEAAACGGWLRRYGSTAVGNEREVTQLHKGDLRRKLNHSW